MRDGERWSGGGYFGANHTWGSSVGRVIFPPGVRDWSFKGIAAHYGRFGGPGAVDQVLPAYDGEIDAQFNWPRDVGQEAALDVYCAERIRGHIATYGGAAGIRLMRSTGSDSWWDSKLPVSLFLNYWENLALDWDARVTRQWCGWIVAHGAAHGRGQPFTSGALARFRGDVQAWHAMSLYSEVTNAAAGGAVVYVETSGDGTPYRLVFSSPRFDRSSINGDQVQAYEVDCLGAASGRVRVVVDDPNLSMPIRWKGPAGAVVVRPTDLGRHIG